MACAKLKLTMDSRRNHFLEVWRGFSESFRRKGVQMKRIIISALIIPSIALASNDTIFEVYDEYYATLPGKLFQGKVIELPMVGDGVLSYGWNGTVDGHRHKVVVRQMDNDDLLLIDNHKIDPKKIKIFPGESEYYQTIDLAGSARSPVVYFASGWACVQSPEPGLAIIHVPVYLIRLQKEYKHKMKVWALPSLHGSCQQIRMQSGHIMFDKVEYRYRKGQDEPIGVSFNEYTIREGKFNRTNKPPQNATFVDPCDVFRFTLDKP